MTIGIYGLFDKTTDECLYVGQSSDIEYRVRQHRKKLRLGSHLSEFTEWFLSTDSNLDRIRYEVLEECADDDATKNLAEIRWFYDMSPRFYGKVPSSSEKWGMSPETKAKISASNKVHAALTRGDAPRLIDRVLQCAFCGVDYSSVSRESKYCSRKCQGTHVDTSLVDNMEVMYKSGMSTREISKIVGFSFKTVSRHLRARGVPLRGRGPKKA